MHQQQIYVVHKYQFNHTVNQSIIIISFGCWLVKTTREQCAERRNWKYHSITIISILHGTCSAINAVITDCELQCDDCNKNSDERVISDKPPFSFFFALIGDRKSAGEVINKLIVSFRCFPSFLVTHHCEQHCVIRLRASLWFLWPRWWWCGKWQWREMGPCPPPPPSILILLVVSIRFNRPPIAALLLSFSILAICPPAAADSALSPIMAAERERINIYL